MADWDARQYLKFEDERTRPALDLLGRVADAGPGALCVDLGCGPGNSTESLRNRFPEARVIGLDTSDEMLAAARARLPETCFEKADIARWTPEAPVDVIFANAVLQWLPDHSVLFPRLASLLNPGGTLAVQMPDNLEEPTHRLMRQIAATPAFAEKLGGAAVSRAKIGSFDDYYDWLRPACAAIDLWQTTYVHPLAGHAAIVEWLRSTGLRPFLDPLDADERQAFLDAYLALIEAHYPARDDGRVLLRFPRLFVVARRT